MQDILPLPKELIDIIYEYNPSHREQLQIVMHELKFIDSLNEIIDLGTHCEECDSFMSPDYEFISNYRHSAKLCSSYCQWTMDYDIRKYIKSKNKNKKINYNTVE